MEFDIVDKVNRVEVIDWVNNKGRVFVEHNVPHVRVMVQDQGRTLKVFMMKKK